MGRVVSIKVPSWILATGEIKSEGIKGVLSLAAAERLEPAFEGLEGDGRIERVRLDQAADDYLSELETRLAPAAKGRICAGLLTAYCRKSSERGAAAKGAPGSRIAQLTAALGMRVRVQQEQLYSAMNAAISARKIGGHEASTGTGKTLAIIASAMGCTTTGDRVVIAEPTINLVMQVGNVLRDLAKAGVKLPAWRLIFGRGEFASEASILLRTSDPETKDTPGTTQVLAWLETARKTGDWRLASLMAASPDYAGISTCAVTSFTEKTDPGIVAYRKQFERDGADLIVCTHAMLAIDCVLRRMRVGADEEYKEASAPMWKAAAKARKDLLADKKPKNADDGEKKQSLYVTDNALRARFEDEGHCHLPPYQIAFVDEAHQLEQAFASTMAVDVSLWQLKSALKSLRALDKDAVSKAVVDKAEAAFKALMPADEDEGADARFISSESDECLILRPLYASLANVNEAAKKCKKDPSSQNVVRAAKEALSTFLKDRNGAALLSFSPSRRYPRLLMGRQTTHREMHYLWTTMKAGVCVSATMFVPRKLAPPSADAVRHLLNISFDRFAPTTPIINELIHSLVTLYTPDPTRARTGWLCRPQANGSKKKYAAAMELWYDQIADTIERAAQTAKGGMLILTTSYAMIEALEARLAGSLGKRLMVSAAGKRMAALAETFLDLGADGSKPVWISTGGAWTGLDLAGSRRGIPAAQDNVLTDLVICNVPWRTNRSLSHVARTVRGTHFEFLDTFLKFKQGIGRLIRNPSPDLPKNRRLWMLDGRIYALAWRGRLESFAAILKSYTKTGSI